MKGNLFFVYEGGAGKNDPAIQCSYQYIYSDGKGKMGRGVEKIHEIINMNPNIAHWNIISMAGASSAGKGKKVADICADSYSNWIEYEFPEADCYFLSVSTMTKHYKGVKDKNVYNNTLAAALPDHFLDYTDFYMQRFPERTIDTIHWDNDTYIDLITDVFLKIDQKRKEESVPEIPAYTVSDTEAVFYTNDETVIYAEPLQESAVILSECEAGLPILVTGVTDNGYFRISLGELVGYVPISGLTAGIGE